MGPHYIGDHQFMSQHTHSIVYTPFAVFWLLWKRVYGTWHFGTHGRGRAGRSHAHHDAVYFDSANAI